MSPAAYYRWMVERPCSWIGLRRFQPRPDQNYPAVVALLGPIVLPLLCLGLFHLVASSFSLYFKGDSSASSGVPGFVYRIVAVMGFAVAVAHWGFTCLVWNQRAAALRLGQPWVVPEPSRWYDRWLLGPAYVLVIGFLTPQAFLIGVENLRGSFTWNQVRSTLQAKGERLFIREMVPSPVPSDQNFAGIPLLADIFRYERGHWQNTNALNRLKIFDLPWSQVQRLARENKREDQGDQLPSVQQWAAAFRAAAVDRAKPKPLPSDTALPAYPMAPPEADAATVVLTSLGVAEKELNQLCEASQRPYSRFAIHWEEGLGTLLPHLAHLKTVVRHLEVRTQAYLEAGRNEEAFASALCSFRLAESLREEPALISQAVRFAMIHLTAETVWQGIAAHRWSDAQLQEFQKRFGQLNYLPAMLIALEGERGGCVSAMERWVMSPRQLREELDQLGAPDGSSPPEGVVLDLGRRLILRGWIRQNQATYARALQVPIEEVRRLTAQLPTGGCSASLATFDQAMTSQFREVNLYNLFASRFLPALSQALDKAVRANQTVKMAATACALERSHLKAGAYPESLTSLVPEFLVAVPLDDLDGQSLRYRRTDDGYFKLWSVGRDGKDDGGTARLPKGTSTDHNRKGLDWVWPRSSAK